MKITTLLILFLVVLIGVLTFSILKQKESVPVSIPQQTEQPEAIKPSRQPIVHYPVPEVPAEPEPPEELEPLEEPEQEKVADPLPLPKKLPILQQSDESIQAILGKLVKSKSDFKLLRVQNFIQKLVATIDNLPEKRLSKDHLPIYRPRSRFIVSGTTDSPQTSKRNQKRYTKHVELIEAINPELAVKVYVHFYPLFQAAYKELGYPNAYFNDRLVYVIDHLLETPDLPDPIPLEQPLVLYTYANPALEKRSSGQKILLRIGPENRRRVKTLLKKYRGLLVNLAP